MQTAKPRLPPDWSTPIPVIVTVQGPDVSLRIPSNICGADALQSFDRVRVGPCRLGVLSAQVATNRSGSFATVHAEATRWQCIALLIWLGFGSRRRARIAEEMRA